MNKDNLVRMPLRADPRVIYFGIGGKRYALRITQQSDRNGGRRSAPVVAINEPTSHKTSPSIATAAKLNSGTPDHHVPDDAPTSGLAPDDLPSVDEGTDLYFGGNA